MIQNGVAKAMGENQRMKMYKIFADYRPRHLVPEEHYYYVWGKNKSQAKTRFISVIGWLKIYSIVVCDEEIIKEVKNNPMKYILI